MKQDFDTNNVLGLECDVSEPDQVDQSVNRVLEQFGRIDVLVNNAGIAEFKPMLETTYEEWSPLQAATLRGPTGPSRLPGDAGRGASWGRPQRMGSPRWG